MSGTLSTQVGVGGRRLPRARRLLLFSLLAGTLTACATKRDIRDLRTDLRTEMESLGAKQDSISRLLRMQNRQILDSLTLTTERLLNVRGELANQLNRLQEQLEQVGSLTAQVQVRLNQLDQQLADAVRQVRDAGLGGGTQPPDGGGDDTFDEPKEFYDIGVEALGRGNPETARRAFQMVVDSFPNHRLAPEAQRQIGETYYLEKNFDRAIQSLDRVVERWQNSEAAPLALYRAGVISQERGNIDRARQYFRRVISGYPNSDARRLAEDALERLG